MRRVLAVCVVGVIVVRVCDGVRVFDPVTDGGAPFDNEDDGEDVADDEPELLDETCPECGRPLARKVGRYGPFVGCSGYPECRYIKKEAPKSFSVIGAELGYRYAASPIVCDEPGGPAPDIETYRPTTWPGARLPHVWLDDGSAMQDRIPASGYTILRLGKSSVDVDQLKNAIAANKGRVFVAAADAKQCHERDCPLPTTL